MMSGNMIAAKCLVAFAILFASGGARGVIMPPRLYSSNGSMPDLFRASDMMDKYDVTDDDPDDHVPYILSITEGSSLDVKTNSLSSITINLNRPVSHEVNVEVQVYSGPNLISFVSGNNASSNHAVIITKTYPPNTYGDKEVEFTTTSEAGHAEIVCRVLDQAKSKIKIDDSSAYISIDICKNLELNILIDVVGWIYFAAWSLSFYFQVILNYQRKSVIGLNFDFLALNLLGFTCYAIYNFCLMFSREVQNDYYKTYTYRRIPVEYNDLFFAIHAVVLTLITVIQCFIYEKGEQKISILAGIFIGASSFIGLVLYFVHIFQAIAILEVILYLSYVKLAVTLIKYTPQAYMNYKRKTTSGWSIHNILLDFTGGVFSIAQMFLLSYNYDDWISIFGNFTKFGLGVISIAFDTVFVVQHYFLYKEVGQLDVSTESIPSPVISDTVRSVSYRQPGGQDEETEQQS